MKRVAINIALTLYAITVILPLLWMVMTAFKSGPEIFASPWALPSRLSFDNFANAWEKAGIARYFMNSLVVCVASLAILIPVGAMAAYIFARFSFPGRNLLFGTFTGGMMFPQFLAIVPLFMLMARLNLLDTRHGLVIVYVAYSLSFTVFVLTGFFAVLPKELDEAAMLDGCTENQTFWRVMMPLARPGLVVVAIFNAIGLWNEYSLALVLVSKEENRTLPLGIANLTMVNQYQSDWGALFAGLVIVMLPVLALYWVYRDKIHETMLAGAVKG